MEDMRKLIADMPESVHHETSLSSNVDRLMRYMQILCGSVKLRASDIERLLGCTVWDDDQKRWVEIAASKVKDDGEVRVAAQYFDVKTLKYITYRANSDALYTKEPPDATCTFEGQPYVE